MAAITPALVNELRNKSGQGMMECKKMLVETNGDVDKAIAEFRKKGVKTSISDRAATEGRAAVAVSADKKTAAAVIVTCNTDFSAKSDPVAHVLDVATKKLVANPNVDLANDPDVKEASTAASQKVGENIQVGKCAAVSGETVGAYFYAITGKIAVIMAFKGSPSEDTIKALGGHIAFAKPLGLTRDEIPADLVAAERNIAVEQAKATGKPQQIAEKIAEGKMNAFFAERALLDQEFFNSQVFAGSVQKMLAAQKVELVKYVRLEVGQ